MESINKVPKSGRQGALNMLRLLSKGVGNDSTLSSQLTAITKPESSHPAESRTSTVTQESGYGGIQLIPAPDMLCSTTGQNVQESSSRAKNPFHVDTAQLRAVPLSQQASEIQSLGLTVYNQQEFEDGTLCSIVSLLS